MFAPKNRICDPPGSPDRRSSPWFDSKIKSGAYFFLIRRESLKFRLKGTNITISDNQYQYAFDICSLSSHRTKPKQGISKIGDG